MRKLALNLFFLITMWSAPALAQEPIYKVTFEEDTPLGFAITFLIEDEGYTLINSSALNGVSLNGTFSGQTLSEVITLIARSKGYSVKISNKAISLSR